MKQKVNMHVPLLDLSASYKEILADVETKINSIIRSGQFILGPIVEELEKKVIRTFFLYEIIFKKFFFMVFY